MRFNLLVSFLTLCCAHVWAEGWAQVTISEKNLPIGEFFDKVTEQTGYTFFYNNKELKKIGKVDVSLRNVTLEEALKQVLKGLPFRYDIVDNTVVVRAKPVAETVARMIPASALMEIHGKVTDKAGKPLAGVNIRVSGIKNPIQTNGGGYYTVPAAEEDASITFSLVGYKSVDRRISDAKDGQLDVVMEEDRIGLDEVIVTGYQEIKRDSYTGTAVTVSGEQLKQVNPQNLLQSIQTFDPSFKLLDNNLAGSNPNVMPTINVRGSSALPTGSNDILRRDNISSSVNMPAFILDGYEVSVEKVFDMDMNRIASITLLKDAAATAIYGSRAANGVLVITTKAPKDGKLQVSYNHETNINSPDLTDYHVLNAADKLQYEVLAGLYDATKQMNIPQDRLTELYYHRLENVIGGVNTYWLSQPLNTAIGQKHSVYLEGGSPVFRYGIDLRYQTRPGVMKESGRDQYSGGMNFSYNLNNKIKFQNELSMTQVRAQESPYGSFAAYVRMNPYYRMTDDNGNILQQIDIWSKPAGGGTIAQDTVLSPLYNATLSSFDKTAYTEIIDNLSAEFELARDLRLRGQLSMTKRLTNGDNFVSPLANEFAGYAPSRTDEKGRYVSSNDNEMYWDGNIRLNWIRQVRDHSFNFVGGANVRTERADWRSYVVTGFPNDRFTSIGFANGYGNATQYKAGSLLSESRLFGAFLSTNYSFRDKYLADATVRADGSSKFGTKNHLAPFWSGGLGWNLHKEPWFKSKAISQLRLRFTMGLTGSVQFDPYLSRTTYVYDQENWYSSGIGATVGNYGNENLSWQKTNNSDLGFDLGLFNDRFFFSPRIYRKLTKGILADISIAPSTGFSSYKENLGDMENKGFELNFRWAMVQNQDWTVSLMANMVHNSNKIVRISNSLKAYNDRVNDQQANNGDLRGVPLLRYNEGQSFDAIYAVPSLGIDPESGREVYLKRDGTLTYNWDVRDIAVVGDATPTAEGSFGGTFRYRQFMVVVNFQTRFGGDMYNQTLVDRVENADPRYNVDSRVFEDKWQQPGDVTFYKNIADLGLTQVSSRFVQPDNLLNLQSVYCSYDFSKRFASRLAMSSLRLGMTANDILRWSSVQQERGIDYPFARSLTLSLQATFN